MADLVTIHVELDLVLLSKIMKFQSHGGTPNSWMIYKGKSMEHPMEMDDFPQELDGLFHGKSQIKWMIIQSPWMTMT